MRIADRVSSRQNNFNALRLIAAIMVLVSHSFALTGHPEPFGSVSGQALGELGVSIFFAISGFLIARSWNEDPSPSRFALKRALRLIPALVVAVLLTALVLGPAVTTLSPASYLAAPDVYAYIAKNSVLYTVNGHLPGVFVNNAYPAAVNGSLWTLPVEAIAYMGAGVLGVLGAIRSRVALPVLSFALLLLLTTPLVNVGAVEVSGPVGGHLGLVLYLGALFNGGVLLYVLRDRVVLRWDIAALLTVVWIVTFDTTWVHAAATLAIPYLVLILAYRTPRRLNVITRPGDLSYGVYIYAFPAQQLASYLWGPRLAPGVMIAVVALPVYALAFASWRLIEAPALRLKRRVASADPRAPLAPMPSVEMSGAGRVSD